MALIEALKLEKHYQGRPVLKGISLQINEGEVLALIGPRGAGKTTLLRILDLLELPSSGEVYFQDVNVTSSGRLRLWARRRMSFVAQKPVVFSGSVRDNVACGLKWRGGHSKSAGDRIEATLGLIGMSEYVDRDAKALSVGEMQMVALARALVSDPEVLFLDEPTASLDPVSAAKVETVLQRLIRSRKTTVVMTTHDMGQGQRLAQRIGVLMAGELLQIGEPFEIFCSPVNKKVAEFVGAENILAGRVESKSEGLVVIDVGKARLEAITDCEPGDPVWVTIRPEDINFARVRAQSSARNVFWGIVTKVANVGALVRIEVDCGFPLLGVLTKKSAEDIGIGPGAEIYVSFKATAVHVIRRE